MNLEPTAEQQHLSDAVATVVGRRAGQLGTGAPEKADVELMGALGDAGFLDVVRDAGPIEGVLVLESAVHGLARAPVAERVLVGPLAGLVDLPEMVGIADRPDGALVRYASDCEAFLVLDGSEALLASADDVEVEPCPSRFESPLGRVVVRRSAPLGEQAGDRLRRAWQVAIAVEGSALMRPAIAQTVAHVTARHQFGRPIGSFQAVQHRLARAYAMAEATTWLARRAAWFNEQEFLTASAAAYACAAAELTYANTHQVTGAIGITAEYGLYQRTLRLVALQRLLGGRRCHARRVAAARRRMDLADVPLPVHPGQ